MTDKETDIGEMARAREWLEMARGKWRLQTMQHRSRYNPKTGEYRQLPTRIRRFLNGTPVGMKSLVLAILKESAPYSSPVFDCEVDEGLLYAPTNTFIRKDGLEHTTNGKDATYTIIQDLMLVDERGDTFGFGDESGCDRVGETEYHWDEPSVADCPDGGQGVSYQVTDVSRDRDTDLFSYRVRKVQALTVHTPPQVAECDARKRVTVETWDNVYGEPGAYRRDPVRGASAPVDVPAPCGQPGGTSVKVDVYRNPDCTYRVTIQRTYAVTDDGADHEGAQYSVYKDQYKTEETSRTFNAFAPLPKSGVEYSGGVVTRYSSERNGDGTWNNSTEVETERPVVSSTVETRQTPRGTHVSRVDTNQPAAAAGISTQFGSWKSTRTKGGLFTNEYSEYTRAVRDNLGLVCTDTAFLKTHETQSSVDAVPAAGTHVPPPSGGLVTTWTYDTDADGFVTRRERTEQEHLVEGAVVRKTVGWLGTSTSYTNRGMAPAAAQALYDSVSGRGSSAEMRVTNGDLRDVEVQTFSRASGVALGVDCSRTIYQHVHETAESASAMGTHASAAGNGHTYQLSYSRDPSTGAITKRSRDTHEERVDASRVTVRVTARGTETRTTNSNVPSRPATPTKPGKTLEVERTPGGLYNVTEGDTVPNPGKTGASCEQDRFLHTDADTAVQTAKPAGDVEGGSGGFYRERTARLGDDGLWEVTTAEHHEKEVTGEKHVSVTARAKRTTTITRQTSSTGTEPAATAADAGKELRLTATRGGLWTVEQTSVEAIGGDSLEECSRDLFLHRDTTGSTQAAAEAGHLTGGSGGVYRERRQQLGDDGLWSVVTTESQEQAVTSQRVERRVTRHGLVTRTTDVQVESPGGALAASAANVGREQSYEKTRGGRYNVTTGAVVPLSGVCIDESCERTAFLHSHSSTKVKSAKGTAEADAAAGGKFRSKAWTLTDQGAWEARETENTEEQPTLKTHKYQDAFGKTVVTEEFSNTGNDGGQGGMKYTAEALVQSVEAQLTNGGRYTVHTKEETPTEVDSGWLHFEKTTDKGLAVYYDFIVFRNAKKSQMTGWINAIRSKISYSGGVGAYSNHPSISVSPNRFGLWDGTIAITTTFTPKAWASGGTDAEDNWDTGEFDIMSVNFVPVSGGKLLKVVSKERHKQGGGVGKDKLKALLKDGVIKGSQFSFHPGGQTFSFDIITKVETKGVLVGMPTENATSLWNGNAL